MHAEPKSHASAETYLAAIAAGDRATLARAITLVESRNPAHRKLAQEVLEAAAELKRSGLRVGITGVPGVGKSTTIDQLGINLIADGQRVAVLAVDPTSQRSGGSILGDKTRMARLSLSPDAYIRPSPTSGTLGGVTRKTRETMALVEAAGFDVIVVETVGVGQSETAVAGMVDIFVALLLPGGGDELQGIKKGVIELADIVAINKADGDNVKRAERTAASYQAALGLLSPRIPDWQPPVLTISGQDNLGLDQLWALIVQHQALLTRLGLRESIRAEQASAWLHEMVRDELWTLFLRSADGRKALTACDAAVRAGEMTPSRAVDQILAAIGLDARETSADGDRA
ncbi:MAG: methylmalonyl Co-A mutase-associated GTPase MeaB [Pseudomonadota bacterium]